MLAGLLTLLVPQVAAAAAGEVRISGTGSGVGGMRLLAAGYMRAHPEARVVVLPALGSQGGIAALQGGRLDVAVSNRAPSAGELARGALVSFEYARTPFVVVVGPRAGVTSLSAHELATLYGEVGATFPNGARARPVLRPGDEIDNRLLRSFSPAMARALDEAVQRRGMLSADTDSEAADIAERIPGALAVSTLALVESEQRALVPLAIDGRVPTVANLVAGSYPWYKSLFLIVLPDADAQTRRFVDFVRSPPGQAVLRAHGHAPL